jgi:hypothetical protein
VFRGVVVVGKDSPEILIWDSVLEKTFHLVLYVFRITKVFFALVLDPANGIECEESNHLTCELGP